MGGLGPGATAAIVVGAAVAGGLVAYFFLPRLVKATVTVPEEEISVRYTPKAA